MKRLKAQEIETYKGYRIKDYSDNYGPDSFSAEGCIWLFTKVEFVREYIDEHNSISPSIIGTMEYHGIKP